MRPNAKFRRPPNTIIKLKSLEKECYVNYAMDNALTCHTGHRGWNTDMTKDFSAPILSGTPAICTLSDNVCRHLLYLEYSPCGRYKERNHGKILAAPYVGQNTDIGAMYGRKGVKKYLASVVDDYLIDLK